MANLKYTSDIVDYVLFKSGEKTDGTSSYNAKALEYINSAYRKIWTGGSEFDVDINENWIWLRDRGTLTLQPKITTGTISIVNNSTSATLSASQSTSTVGYYFKITGHEDIFRVSAHTAGTTAVTLDSVYTGTTNTAASYTLFKLDYTLASDVIDVLSPITTQRANGNNGRIEGVSLSKIPTLSTMVAGVPEKFSYISDTTIRFDKYVDTEMVRIDYWYKKRPADLTDSPSEEPVVPLRHRHVLGNIALMDLLIDMNDDRAEAAGLISKQGLLAMSRENQARIATIGSEYAAVIPRWDLLNSFKPAIEPY